MANVQSPCTREGAAAGLQYLSDLVHHGSAESLLIVQ